MTVHVKHNSADGQIAIEGEMTIYHAVALKRQILDSINNGSDVSLDLSRVTELDTAGMQLLMMARQEAQHHGRSAQLLAPSAAVRDALELYNLGSWLDSPPAGPGQS